MGEDLGTDQRKAISTFLAADRGTGSSELPGLMGYTLDRVESSNKINVI